MDLNFPLTQSDTDLSKRLFNGHLVRVIFANGARIVFPIDARHPTLSSNGREVFPENHLSVEGVYKFVSGLTQDSVIVTNNPAIATSVPKGLCRIFKDGVLTEPKNETFGQMQIDFLLDIDNRMAMPETAANFVRALIARIDTMKWKTDEAEKQSIIQDLELVADEVIYFHLYGKMGITKRRKEWKID
jgi:hypothetical protein